MPAVVLVALFLSIYYLRRGTVADAVIYAYLPALFLMPDLYSLAIPHLPLIGFAQAAILPIGVAIFTRHRHEWTFQRIDVWMLILIFEAAYTESVRTVPQNGGLQLFTQLTQIFIPYAIGKVVLEQDGVRIRFIRQFVLLLSIIALFYVWEFRIGTNFFTTIVGRFFPGQSGLPQQARYGFLRAVGPFVTSELAGMVFCVGWVFSIWLIFTEKWNVPTSGPEKRLLGMRRSVLFAIANGIGLLMTISRGPILGAILAFVIAWVGRAKNVRRAAILCSLLLTVGGVAGYIKANEYTSIDYWDAQTQEQQNAIYRRQLLDNYKPIVERGGLIGWGFVDPPKVPGQDSVDNNFLLIRITQGQIGIAMFFLICAESALAIYSASRRSTQTVDLYFYLSIAGILAGLLLCLATVFMGAQSRPVFYLLIGWSMGLRQTATSGNQAVSPSTRRFAFRRVFA